MSRPKPRDRPQVLVLAPALPSADADNAGGRYVTWVVEALTGTSDVVVVAPDGPASRRAISSGSTPPHVLLKRSARSRPLPGAGWMHRLGTVALPATSPWPLGRDLVLSPSLRNLVRSADVIDLQWEEQGRLIQMVRRLNPEARVVCTLHDVLSQRYGRAADEASSASARTRWAWARTRALSLERRLSRSSDAIIVFSDKDASLIPTGRADVHVVAPPLARRPTTQTRCDRISGRVLFVGLLSRWENEEGLLWFLTEVWPQVIASVLGATFQIAGARPSPGLVQAADHVGAELLGFVPDLDALYGSAEAVVAPLRLGAGVKFKVVEALLAGTPVVTTAVGAEGIGDPSWFADGATHDTADDFAAALIAVLNDPDRAQDNARRAQGMARDTYANDRFERTIAEVYEAQHGREPTADAGSTHPVRVISRMRSDAVIDVTVVIPVYNGAATLDQELAALAAQHTNRPFEVLISDNGSTDSTRQVAQRWADRFAAFTIIDSGQARGVSHARNQGALAALGSKVLICDADDAVCPTWVEPIASALDAYDLVGAAARPFVGALPDDLSQAPPEAGLNRVLGYLPYALGGSMGVRRETLLAIGGYDGSFSQGHEEADFSWRAQLAGYTLGFAEGAFTNYRQKDSPYAVGRQNYFFAKSSILLWCRYASDHPLSPVSIKAAGRRVASQGLRAHRLLSRDSRPDHARELGWALGLLAGHVEYRLLKRLPPRDVMALPQKR